MIKPFNKFINEANHKVEETALEETIPVNEWVDNNLSPDLCAVTMGKDIIIFDLSSNSKVDNEGGAYGSIDVQIAASIKEAKSTKVHTVEVQISYTQLHGRDNWEGNLIFDGKSRKLDENSCVDLCEPILERNVFWYDKSNELKDFTGQLITDLISGKYIKMS